MEEEQKDLIAALVAEVVLDFPRHFVAETEQFVQGLGLLPEHRGQHNSLVLPQRIAVSRQFAHILARDTVPQRKQLADFENQQLHTAERRMSALEMPAVSTLAVEHNNIAVVGRTVLESDIVAVADVIALVDTRTDSFSVAIDA